MIKSITIYYPTGCNYFEIGESLLLDNKPTEIKVLEIKYFLNDVVITLSNKEKLKYHNLPFSLDIKY